MKQRGLPAKGVSSKWSKTTPVTTESVSDGHETVSAQQPKEESKTAQEESKDSRAEVQPRGGKSVTVAEPEKPAGAKEKTDTVTEGTLQLLTSGVTGGEYQQIVSSLMDMRVDLKLEIQRLNLKVSRIDEHLVELVKKMPRLPVKAEPERTSDGRPDPSYRRGGGDHSKHTCSKGGKKDSAPKKRGPKSKSWTSSKTSPPPAPSRTSPNDSAVRAMLENEIEELQRDSLPNETQ